MNVEGGNLVSNNDVTIYLPAGTLNITGGEIVGATAVYSKCGVTNISGNPVIKGEGNKENFQHTGNGCYPTGDAMVVEACNYPNGNPEVYISGGTFTSKNGASVAYYQHENNEAEKFSITGGTFSSDVSDYVSSGYECKEDSDTQKWVVNEMTPGEMVVKPETGDDNSASATLDGVYTGQGTSITTEGSSSSEDNETDVAEDATVTVDLTKENTTTSATLTVTDVAAASLSSAPSLTVKTDAGDVTLPEDALQKVAEAGEKGNNVTVTVTKDSISASNIEAAYTVKVEANGENLLPASATDNGDITITVAKPEGESTIEAWYAVKNASGAWLPVELLDSKENNGKLAITITHLSTVILYNTPQNSTVVATVKTSDNQTTSYTNLQTAIGAAGNGATVTLWQDVVLDGDGKGNTHGLLTISNKNITIDGNGKTIRSKKVTVNAETEAGPSMINVESGANVTFRNLTIDGAIEGEAKTKHGLNIYKASVTVENVTINNNRWYAIVANGSNLTVNGLTTEDNQWGINVESKSGPASITVKDADIAEPSSIVFENSAETSNDPTGTIKGGDFQYIIFKDNAKGTHLEISGGKFATDPASGGTKPAGAVDISEHLANDDVKWDPTTGVVGPKRPTSTTDDTPSLGYRLPYIGESTGGKNFVSDTTSNLTVNGKYQFRITSTDGHKPVMTVSNSNFTVELASQSGNDYFYVIRCAGAAGSTANVLVDGIHVVVATVGTAGVVSDTTHPFTVAQGAAYQFKLTSASRPTFTGNNANFTIAYVSNSGNDWFFKVTAVGAAGASTTFSANGVVVTTATIA